MSMVAPGVGVRSRVPVPTGCGPQRSAALQLRDNDLGAATPSVSLSGAPPAAKPHVEGRLPVVAPLLGTFYRSPQPGAKPFVEEGEVIDQGQPVAIVEAMKIMNQVASEHSGRVAEILVKDGDWVEFQQVLMYLEPVEA